MESNPEPDKPVPAEIPSAEFAALPTRAENTSEYAAPSPPLTRLQPGQTLGQYRILQRLGAGGMGEVYKAIHLAMDRVVALKVLGPNMVQDPRARARFQREIRGAGRLNHPNIVMAHDADEAAGHYFLVMEFVEGCDLAELVRQRGRPPAALACEIARQVALGLQHAHENGLVHRDIKPANLMLAFPPSAPAAPNDPGTTLCLPDWPTPPVVKILDFGLARLVHPDNESADAKNAVTREGTVVGTPEFMSPEQATGEPGLDVRSDVYSLGCTLYFLLAGRPPFVSKTVHETITRHLTEPPQPLHHVWPEVPPALAAIVARMLAKRPEDRYQTPAEVARVLLPWSLAAAQTARSSGNVSPSTAPALPAAPRSALPLPRGPLSHPPYRSGEGLRKVGFWLILMVIIGAAVLVGLKILDLSGGTGEKSQPFQQSTIPPD
jgi:serine/threonine-protein kinase